MKYFIIHLLAFIFIGSSAIVNAQNSLDSTAIHILTNSPEFKTETYQLESTSASLQTESNLPDPEISGEYLVMPRDVDNRWALQLEWGLEWPGVYSARAEEAKSKMSAARLEIWTKRAEKLAEIKDLLLDYIRCHKKINLLKELSNNNDTIYYLAEQAARGGEMTILDLNKVKLEYANIRVAMASLLDEEAKVIANISQIYGQDCRPVLERMTCEFPPIIFPSEEQIAEIKKNAPAVQAALADLQTAKSGKKVTSREALPSISLGYKHAFEDGMHFNGAVFGISVPMFSSRGKQKAAKAKILEAEVKAEATAAEIETEAEASLRRLRIICDQIDEIAPIIENVDYNSTLLKAYKAEVITLIEYITDRNYFTNAAVELVSLRHNAAKALAFLNRFMTVKEF